MTTIAIVYGDSSAAASMMRIIASAGMLAETYSGVVEFLSDREDEEFDCLLLDSAFLEDPDARSELEKSRNERHPQPLPVVVLSNSEDPVARRRAREFGADAFFTEPLDGETLLDAIRWECVKGPAGA